MDKEFLLTFKTTRVKEEFWDEFKFDARLRAIIFELARFVGEHFNKKIVVTCCCRTEQEQIQTYPHYFREHKIAKPSAHCDKPCRAVDIRSYIYTREEIMEMDNWFSHWFDLGEYYSFIHHDVAGVHIHIQLAKLRKD